MNTNYMKVSTRIGMGFVLVAVALAGVGIAGLIISNLGLHAVSSVKRVNDVSVMLANARSAVWELRSGVAHYISVTDADARARFVADSERLHKQLGVIVKDYRSSRYLGDLEKALLKDLDASMERYYDARRRWFEIHDAGRIAEAATLRDDRLTPAAIETIRILGDLIGIQQKYSDRVEGGLLSDMNTMRGLQAALLLVALILAAVCGWWVNRGLQRQLGGEPSYAAAVVNRIAAGDMSGAIAVKSGDISSLMAAIERMQRNIREHIEGERRLDAENRRVERRLAELLNLAPDAIIAMDASHRIIVFNKSAERTFGYRAAEILGRPLEDLIPVRFAGTHGKQVAAFSGELKPSREMGGRGGLTGLRKDGSEFPAEASISILREETGPVFFAILRDVTEKKQVEQKLEQLAMHDGLTGLPNRNLFMDRLSRALVQSEREQKRAALLFMDLDGFKAVNDTLGHAAGDELLCVVAQRLQGCVRRSDTVARLGGDEFAVILEQIQNEDSVSAIAQTIIDAVHEPVRLGNNHAIVSVSIGIALFPGNNQSLKELMMDADRAMYVAKNSGKNHFEFHVAEPAFAGMPRGTRAGGDFPAAGRARLVHG